MEVGGITDLSPSLSILYSHDDGMKDSPLDRNGVYKVGGRVGNDVRVEKKKRIGSLLPLYLLIIPLQHLTSSLIESILCGTEEGGND